MRPTRTKSHEDFEGSCRDPNDREVRRRLPRAMSKDIYDARRTN